MELSEKDRLILSNQYEILEKLDPDQAERYQRLREILQRGYSAEYGEMISLSDPLSTEECKEVSSIIEMHRQLQRCNEVLDPSSRVDPKSLKFDGFDGNEETAYYLYATFLVETLKRWSEFASIELNSHHETLDGYRRMLEQWEASESKYKLTASDIGRIVAARHEEPVSTIQQLLNSTREHGYGRCIATAECELIESEKPH